MGVLGAVLPYLAVAFLKQKLGYDDALDTFGIHGIGGTLGAVLTGVFADPAVNPVISAMKLKEGLLMEQFKAIGLTIVLSVVATLIITFIVKMVVGLRPTPEDERVGLDLTDHNEQGYEH